VTIYYYSSPAAQPAPATVVTDNYFGAQDIYVNQNGSARAGVLGSGLSAGKITLSSYDATKSFVGSIGSVFPGLATPPVAPSITAATYTPGNSTLSAAQGTAISFNPLYAYGGAGVANQILNVTISPALPAGLTLKKSKVNLNVAGAAPTVSGSGTTWSATYTIASSSGTAPVVGSFYSVRGQTKTSYNGVWQCTAATPTTITLKYNANPSSSGGANPAGQVAWDTGAATTISDAGIRSITGGDGVNYWYNYVDIIISGTPSVASAVNSYVVTFTDASGQTATNTFNLEVIGSVVAELSSTLAVASKTLVQNVAVAAFTPVTAQGGTAPII